MSITVTERAAKEVMHIVADNPPDEGRTVRLRIKVIGGGCSGFQHKLELDDEYDEKRDELFDTSGIQLVVDKRSLIYLEGATVDFHDDLNKRGFSVENPRAVSKCGCGSSFQL